MVQTSVPHTNLPLDLPHAGRIAHRMCRVLESRAGETGQPGYADALAIASRLHDLLFAVRFRNEAPEDAAESECLRQAAAVLGRDLTDVVVRHGLQDDRLGQCVRNLFECLGWGREGAVISLRAGENPLSLQRPV